MCFWEGGRGRGLWEDWHNYLAPASCSPPFLPRPQSPSSQLFNRCVQCAAFCPRLEAAEDEGPLEVDTFNAARTARKDLPPRRSITGGRSSARRPPAPRERRPAAGGGRGAGRCVHPRYQIWRFRRESAVLHAKGYPHASLRGPPFRSGRKTRSKCSLRGKP